MDTNPANEAKADFQSIYEQATPHAYYSHLGQLDYSICDETSPFCVAAAEMLRERHGGVRMLDIGSSYGINAATIRHGLSFAELNRLLELNVSRDGDVAPREALEALAATGVQCAMQCGGLDTSTPAIRFATRAGILDHGIVANLEADGARLQPDDAAWVSKVDLLLSTGAIGYVTDRTLRVLLDAIGDRCSELFVMLTVLRMFDTGPIAKALAEHGLETATIPGVLIPQRRFEDDTEQQGVVALLEQHGLDATLERDGRHFARLVVAASPERLPELVAAMQAVAARRPTLATPPADAATAMPATKPRPADEATKATEG